MTQKKTSRKKTSAKTSSLPSHMDIQAYIESLTYSPSLEEIMAHFKVKKKKKGALISRLKKKKKEDDPHFSKGGPSSLKKETKSPKVLQVVVTKKENHYLVAKPINSNTTSYVLHINTPKNDIVDVSDIILVFRKNLIKKNIYKASFLKKFTKERTSDRDIIGVIKKLGKKRKLFPVDRRLASSYQILEDSSKGDSGDLVKGAIVRDYGKSGGCVSIKKILCRQADPKFISLIDLYQSDIPYKFSKKALDLADSAELPPLEQREDLRHIPLVTIDQEDAKDFDDAVFAEKTDQGWHIIVAIADVAYYVPYESVLDKEAYERGNSTYFPNLVIPMLPESLSNGMCSLRPNEDRASIAVHMWIDTQGNLLKHRFSRALIKSHARLTYNLVQQVYNAPETNPKVWDLISPLYGAYQCLQHDRVRRGTLELELEEPCIIFDKAGSVKEISSRQRLESHKLIEEMMILANISAAKSLSSKNMPSLFRIHEKPNTEKVLLLLNALKTMGIEAKNITKATDPHFFNAILESAKSQPTWFLVQDLVLRTQAQAFYRPENIGHFGLSLDYYTHFTSPIRRYADLVVHRSLITALNLGIGGWDKAPSLDLLKETGTHLSTTERTSKMAERNAINRYMISFLEDKVGAHFHGHISGVHTAGLFIELDDTGAEGFLPKGNLPHDVYRLLETKPCLQGRGNSFTLGDPIRVKLKEANAYKNGMIFSFLGK